MSVSSQQKKSFIYRPPIPSLLSLGKTFVRGDAEAESEVTMREYFEKNFKLAYLYKNY